MKKVATIYSIGLTCILLFIFSTIPYLVAMHRVDEKSVFLGQITYLEDQNMYFSFIRQAYDSAFLFCNKLTHLPHKPVLLNVQWLWVGKIWRLLRLNENQVYQVWRFAGIVALVLGFFFLSALIFQKGPRRFYARVLFFCGGGFGFFVLIAFALGWIDEQTLRNNIADLATGAHPFQQMTSNPHFSFPHGLFLIAMALFVLAERRNALLPSVASGMFFFLCGLSRPYDLMSVAVIFPLYAIVESIVTGFDLKRFFMRLIPLLVIIPCLAYNLWLFKMHPVFKWWSVQGLNAGVMPDLFKSCLVFGIAGILSAGRILFAFKAQPLDALERFWLVWFVGIFALIRIGKIVPAIGFSPQLGVPLTAPLVLLGFGTKIPALSRSSMCRRVAAAAILSFAITGSTGVILYFSQRFFPGRQIDAYLAAQKELTAFKWLASNSTRNALVVATPERSSRLCKYTGVRSIAGHYSVTPRHIQMVDSLKNLFGEFTSYSAATARLRAWQADFIYVGQGDDTLFTPRAMENPHLSIAYTDPPITIYRVTGEYR